MDRATFTKAEIDLILQRARSARPGVDPSASSAKVQAFDFQGAGQLSSSQTEKLLAAHVEFANEFGKSLSTLLSSECQATPTTVDQLAYGEFIKQTAENVCFGVLQIPATDGRVVVQADPATILPMIDLLLGGDGAAAEPVRPLTGIELEIFRPVMELLGSQLQAAWAPALKTTLRVERDGVPTNLLSATEKVALIKFQIRIGDALGMWTLVLPSAVASGLTQDVEQQSSPSEADVSEQNQRRLRERLLDSRFTLELFLPPSAVSVRKLAHLKAGEVVVLKPRSSDPIHLNLAGINLFQASPVSCGTRRGAQIRRTLSIVKSEVKEPR
jgi:flagellar motor switch protein FliM